MKSWLQENLFFLAEARGLVKTENGETEINQSAVQKVTKVPQTTISGIIKQGKMPRVSTLEKLAKGLGVDAWQILSPPAVLRASLTPKFPELIDLLTRQ